MTVLHILVIDDDPLVAQALRRTLSAHTVTLADGGRRALELLEATPDAFDVIICDVMMPGKSGIELYQDVRRDYPQLLPRFVFTTGGAYQPEAVKFLQEVDAPCLEKPYSRTILASTLAKIAAANQK